MEQPEKPTVIDDDSYSQTASPDSGAEDFDNPPPNLSFKEAIKQPSFKKFMVVLTVMGVIFLLLIIITMSYALGNLHHSTKRMHKLRMLAVDFDGDSVGQAFRQAYENVKGPSFPTLVFQSSDGLTQQDVYDEVFRGHYWAAVYTSPNATDNLLAALGNATIAQNYSAATAMHYVWNQARYTSVSNGAIQSSLSSLGDLTRKMVLGMFGSTLYSDYLSSSPTGKQLEVFGTPVGITAINIQPTPQLSSLMYNTICMVIVILVMFFYVLGTNVVAAELKIYACFDPLVSYFTRFAFAQAFGLVYSLVATGTIWWFREGWGVNGNQFVLTWLVYYLLMSIDFVLFDSMLCYFPPALMPCLILAWIVSNVMSSIVPMPLAHGFYHWAVALPGFNVYNLNSSIWSRGASPIAYRALPILFSWFVICFTTNIFGHMRRAKKAQAVAGLTRQQTQTLIREVV